MAMMIAETGHTLSILGTLSRSQPQLPVPVPSDYEGPWVNNRVGRHKQNLFMATHFSFTHAVFRIVAAPRRARSAGSGTLRGAFSFVQPAPSCFAVHACSYMRSMNDDR